MNNITQKSTLSPSSYFSPSIPIKYQPIPNDQLDAFVKDNKRFGELPEILANLYKHISNEIDLANEKKSKNTIKTIKFFISSLALSFLSYKFFISSQSIDLSIINDYFKNIMVMGSNLTPLESLFTTFIISIGSILFSDLLAQTIIGVKKDYLRTIVVVASALIANIYYHIWFNFAMPFIINLPILTKSILVGIVTGLDIFLIGGLGYGLIFMLVHSKINGFSFEKTKRKILSELLFLNKDEPTLKKIILLCLEKFNFTKTLINKMQNKNSNEALQNKKIKKSFRDILCDILAKFELTKDFSNFLREQGPIGGVTYRTNIGLWTIPIIWIYATLSDNVWAIMPIVMGIDVIWVTFLSYRTARSNTVFINKTVDKIKNMIDNTNDDIISSEKDILFFLLTELKKNNLKNGEFNYVISKILKNSLKYFREVRKNSTVVDYKEKTKKELEFLTEHFDGIYDLNPTVIITYRNVKDLVENSKCIIRIPQTDDDHIKHFIYTITDNLHYSKNSYKGNPHNEAIKTIIQGIIKLNGLNKNKDFYFEHGVSEGSNFAQYHIKVKGNWNSNTINKILEELYKLGFQNTTNYKPKDFLQLEVYSHIPTNDEIQSKKHTSTVIGIKFPILSPKIINDSSIVKTAA